MPSPVLFHDLWNYDDPEGTERTFADLLESGVDGADADLQLKTQIARAMALQREFDEARRVLDEVEASLPDEPDTARVRWLLESGRVANSSGDPEAAKPLFIDAWELAKDLDLDGLAVDAAHMVAIVEDEAGAMEWTQRALALAESSDDPDAQRWKGSLYNNMGWTHHDAGRFEEALELFQKGVVFRAEQGDDDGLFVARWTVARAKRSLGRLEEALAEQQSLQADMVAAGRAEDGYSSEELGEVLLEMGRDDDARPHFAKAAVLLSADPWLVADHPERLDRLRRLGAGPARLTADG